MKNLILTLVLVSTNAYARPFWAEKAMWEEESAKKVFFVGIAIGAKSEEEGRKLSLDAAQAEVRGYLGFDDLVGFNMPTQMIDVQKNSKGGYDVYRLCWSTMEFVQAFWIVKAKDYANAPVAPIDDWVTVPLN